ncbi:hypothetical protein, partial [Brevibacillus borstelensis]|uniref:hypothetical protein n=1 Tax=Brevibacillus borstelensis TaxID=45462 RepID=UPI0030BF1228
MTIAYISIAIGWAFLVIRITSYLKELKREITFLPETSNQAKVGDVLVGRNIYEMVDLPAKVRGRHAVLLI